MILLLLWACYGWAPASTPIPSAPMAVEMGVCAPCVCDLAIVEP